MFSGQEEAFYEIGQGNFFDSVQILRQANFGMQYTGMVSLYQKRQIV